MTDIFMYTSCIVLYNIRNGPMTALHVCRSDQNVVEDHRIYIVRLSPRSLQKRVLPDQISRLPHLTYTSQILYSYSPHFSSPFYDTLQKLLDFNGRRRSRFWLFGQQGKQIVPLSVFLQIPDYFLRSVLLESEELTLSQMKFLIDPPRKYNHASITRTTQE